MTPDVIFTLFYILFAFFLIYPPNEFISEGITVASIFSNYLGSEHEQFIQYQIKRAATTLIVHSLLPLGYILGIFFINEATYDSLGALWQIIITIALVIPITAILQVYIWSKNKWCDHPIVKNLLKFSNNRRNEIDNWLTLASDINIEYRRVDKISIQTNAILRIVVTDNWILKITPYNIYYAHQSDTSLVVIKSDTHSFSQSYGEVQYINIEVKSSRPNAGSFCIRLNALDFKDLQDRISRPITILPNVAFHKTLMDRFIETFKEVVKENPTFKYNEIGLEPCIGCMQAISNVKLQKICDTGNSVVHEDVDEKCTNCYCRPMWCLECMARWFASRQDSAAPDTWLASKCTCPMCRAKFCLLDVSLVEEESNEGN